MVSDVHVLAVVLVVAVSSGMSLRQVLKGSSVRAVAHRKCYRLETQIVQVSKVILQDSEWIVEQISDIRFPQAVEEIMRRSNPSPQERSSKRTVARLRRRGRFVCHEGDCRCCAAGAPVRTDCGGRSV